MNLTSSFFSSLRALRIARTHFPRSLSSNPAPSALRQEATSTARRVPPPPPPSAIPPTGPSATTLLFYGAPIAITFSLGVWQIQRLSRKRALITERHHRLYATPLTASELKVSPSNDFRRVLLRGRFDHSSEQLVAPRSAPPIIPSAVLQWGGSSGMFVVTPLHLNDGRVVMVSRGWLPHRLRDPTRRANAPVSPLPFLLGSLSVSATGDIDDEVEIVGVVRLEHECNRFTPTNKPEKGEWFSMDPSAMLAHAGVSEENGIPVLVELLEPLANNGWPFPRAVEDFMHFRTTPETHITYATTWFSLSAALALLTRNRLRVRTR